MDENDLNKYVLEQAKIEVEHARSWPAKILAFYVAINFGVFASLVSLGARSAGALAVPLCAKLLVTGVLGALLLWALALFRKNHISYLRHRNIQIRFQRLHLGNHREALGLPQDWFNENDVGVSTRAGGWGFYAYIALVVTALALAGIWAVA